MLTSSRYLINGSPRCCMFCGEPFRPRDGYVEVWRTSARQHFCSEFCADDAEEAQFEGAARPRSPPTPPVPPTSEAALRPATRPAWRLAKR